MNPYLNLHVADQLAIARTRNGEDRRVAERESFARALVRKRRGRTQR